MDRILKTKIVKVDPNSIDYDIIDEAAEIINNGGTVVFPTETVYGIGADALNERAVDKIFKAKGRPQDNPLIVHIANFDELNDLVLEIPEGAKILADNYWPGPLTMVLKKKNCLSDKITAGLDTVAIRFPMNEIALAIIKRSKKPIAAPSANTSGNPSPTKVEHVIQDLMGKVDMIIDGGNTYIGLESTVVDVIGEIPMILRPGGVTIEDIIKVLDKCDYDPAIIKKDEKIIPRSPGQKYRHYSPKAEVILYKGSIEDVVKRINEDYANYELTNKKIGIMSTVQTNSYYKNKNTICVGDRTNPISIASNLFNDLREFDKQGINIILAESVEEDGIGKAIMNRISKAASKTVNM